MHTVDRFLPDGEVQIIFDLTDYPKFIYHNETLKEIQSCKNVWFSGFRTEPITIPSGRESEMVIVQFRKGRAFPFLCEPMQELTNFVVDAELVIRAEILNIREVLLEAETPLQKLQILEKKLLNGILIQRVETGLPSFSDPVFADDGKKVVFRGGTKKSKREADYHEELYCINTDGTDLKQLTDYPESDTTAPWFAYKAGSPKLHPTENFITYQSYQDGKYSLYAVTLDGEKQWKLTENPENEGWHDWSPDGKWLAIELFNNEQTQFHIGLMDWETKEIKILTDTKYHYQQAPNFVLKTQN